MPKFFDKGLIWLDCMHQSVFLGVRDSVFFLHGNRCGAYRPTATVFWEIDFLRTVTENISMSQRLRINFMKCLLF